MTNSPFSVASTLRLIAALTLVLPAIVFGYVVWQKHGEIEALASQRIEHALDVLQEHSLKSLQTAEMAISETGEVLEGMSDADIRAAESDIYLRLKRTEQALPQIEAVWVFDAEGRPLVSSAVLPLPKDLNNSDRSYFRVHREGRTEPFISEIISTKIGSLRVFVVSAPRLDPFGRFNGVIAVTILPEHFSEFYRKLSRGRDVFAITRADGQVLARFPETSIGLVQSAALPQAIRKDPEAGVYTSISRVDGVERRVGYRHCSGLRPLCHFRHRHGRPACPILGIDAYAARPGASGGHLHVRAFALCDVPRPPFPSRIQAPRSGGSGAEAGAEARGPGPADGRRRP